MKKLDFYTSHHQFYIVDENHFSPDNGDLWTDRAFLERMPVSDEIIGISTASYGPIKGSFQFFNSPQALDDTNNFDHIVDGCLKVNSEKIQILDCPDLNVIYEVSVNNGDYCVRLYSSNLNIQDEDEGGDFHRIEIWPIENPFNRKVIKQFNPQQ
ncbi:hypothetical protein [Flagellimonas zhangzhouensis]|uniref:Uncharacterized protein n=1 Tax=Flagellimonas zhangzhouensis TaxID=1073328 RepID=A0A1H2YKI0_9FLAO|nr:hypothetical protein [Allomuricauda zhangzhouensis]SDR02208.1 hypothetical protein SAMN05216294_3176 [Allomuricauda zhangzhouensis]SDX05687.1 hypothetical protein SAMN04487892_3089 [Allomuricauda zhangzhouensis]